MPDDQPANPAATVVPLPRGREPLDPSDPAPDHVCIDLSDWDLLRIEAVFETLWRSDLDVALSTEDQICFRDTDTAAIEEVLDRFRDAPLGEIDHVLDRYADEDFDDEGDDEEGY